MRLIMEVIRWLLGEHGEPEPLETLALRMVRAAKDYRQGLIDRDCEARWAAIRQFVATVAAIRYAEQYAQDNPRARRK